LAAAQGVPLNLGVTNIDYYGAGNNSNNNALLAGLKHQFSHSFLLDAQYTWAKAMDNGSQPYYENPYVYNNRLSWGRADFNVGNAFKLYGLWQPKIFTGDHAWLEKVAGGWSLSGIFNLHTGFPWTALYTASGSLYYTGSPYGALRPGAYLGGAGHDTSNDAFKSGPGGAHAGPNKNFPQGGLAYYSIPSFTSAGGTFPATAPAPPAPGVARNSLNGPNYNDVDATITKGFGLPKLPVLGENAKIEVRADVFNLFNKLNLVGGGADIVNKGINNQINSANFGQAQGAMGSRTVELQARFSF